MLKDIGFWNSKDEYIEDIQEIDEMEMKEVIIDGVNVAECENFISMGEHPRKAYCRKVENSFCDEYNDCYFKQLQRAKEEIMELKNKLKFCFDDMSENFDNFCDICVAKNKCNENCCFNQLKELLYETK